MPRVITAFSGTAGVAVKLALLSVSNALAAWAAYVLIDHRHWIALVVLVAATAAIDLMYFGKRTLPAKFLIPGTLFLICFQIIPIIYTIQVAFTNYSTGHIATKSGAITQIQLTSLQPPANGKQYNMAAARDSSGKLVLILEDQVSHADFVGTEKSLTPLPKSAVKSGPLGIEAAKGYTLIKGNDLFALDQTLRKFHVPTKGESAITPQTISTAAELEPTLRYDAAKDGFVRITDGAVFRDNGNGAFQNGTQELEPGWKTGVGFRNFSTILTSKALRGPFFQIFLWTIVFASSVVFLSFAVGLLLAIVLNKKGLRFQRFYRSLILIPWAVPGFLSLLVWQGLLNDDFGVVNRLFHLNIPWLFDANWAKVSCILVSFWLTVPYFFLVSMGALQSIPEELNEAAHVDGGGPTQIFRRVTLPLVLVATSPLLIASFAFNFNNFNNIYLLTQGGPTQTNQPIAGATDILISYTYKLAIATGKGQDYGLASAVSIVIFFIVATISAVSFSRTKALENVA
ncbi:MAG: maltose/maltodextrin transport system permease protein [Gaiellaceae bacterium]|jgi:arabinogalactan oligomer/maltooligosaccharide transport system permease protein|nr:maltose/maltodextrin transport system permease protein [Gaiellaceae bacterium]